MTTGRINQVAVVLEVRPGEVLRPPGTLVPQTYLDGSAVIPQPDIRQLCPSSNITTLCEARQLFTRRAKPTLTLYSVADCVANLSLSVRQSRCLKAPCTLRRQLPGCPQCSGGREKRQACWTSRYLCLKALCAPRRQLPECPQCSGGREKRQACWTSRSIPSAPWKSSERKRGPPLKR